MEKLSFLLAIIFAFSQLVLGFPSYENKIEARGLSNDLSPNLQCGPKNIIVTFQKEELIRRNLDFENIHLRYPSCKGEVIGDTVFIQTQTDVRYCGTTVTVNATHAIYRNDIFVLNSPSAVIIREAYVFNISCTYPLDMDVSLGTVLKPILSTTKINITGSGEFVVKMALYKDPAYTIPRQYGDTLTTNDMLYVAAFISEGDTNRFHLVLKNCFATPNSNFDDTLKYYMIRNRCKNVNDNTIHVAANGIASYGQFSVQAFRFIGGYSSIYLHCQVHLCDYVSGPCVPVCTGAPTTDFPGEDISIGLGAVAIKDPENICPSLQCGASYINVTFHKNDLTDALIDIPNIQLNQANCRNLGDDGNTVAIGWPLGVGQCGTTMTTNTTHAIYRNSIYLARSPSLIIYRKEYYINVSCAYPLDLNVSLQKTLKPLIRTIQIDLPGVGTFEVAMAVFKDQDYQEPYDDGVLKIYTRTRLFVGVFISRGDTNQFNLVLRSCFATPTNNTQDPTNYGLIVNSCPNENDGTVEIYRNGISKEGRFSFEVFQFNRHTYVYLHCRVHLCSKSDPCEPVCPFSNGRSAEPQAGVITLGPFNLREGDPGNIPTTAKIPAENTTDGEPDTIPTTISIVKATVPAAKDTPTLTTPKNSAGKRMYLDLLMLIAVLLVTVAL